MGSPLELLNRASALSKIAAGEVGTLSWDDPKGAGLSNPPPDPIDDPDPGARVHVSVFMAKLEFNGELPIDHSPPAPVNTLLAAGGGVGMLELAPGGGGGVGVEKNDACELVWGRGIESNPPPLPLPLPPNKLLASEDGAMPLALTGCRTGVGAGAAGV